MAAEWMPNAQIARAARVSQPTVIGWGERYQQGGIAALADEAHSGRPAVIDEIDVVVATLANEGRPPVRLGITHWSARFMAAELGVSFASVARIWRKWNIRPHRTAPFKFSADPELGGEDPRCRRPEEAPLSVVMRSSPTGAVATQPPAKPDDSSGSQHGKPPLRRYRRQSLAALLSACPKDHRHNAHVRTVRFSARSPLWM
jgi:transposase